MQLGSLLLVASFIVSGPNANQIEGVTTGSQTPNASLIKGTVSAKFDVQISASEAGVLDKLMVDVGAVIKKDQPLAKIDDADISIRLDVAKLEHEVAVMESENDSNVKAADFTAGVALAEWDDSLRINKRSPGSIPPTQLRREELTYNRTKMQWEVAKLELNASKKAALIKGKQVAAAQLAVDRRTIKSRYSGVIEERMKDLGEWVSPGDAIYRVVHMDLLKVEGFLDFARYPHERVLGKTVSVLVRYRGRSLSLPGKVVFASQQLDAQNQYQFRVEVQNQKQGAYFILRPGMTVGIKFSN